MHPSAAAGSFSTRTNHEQMEPPTRWPFEFGLRWTGTKSVENDANGATPDGGLWPTSTPSSRTNSVRTPGRYTTCRWRRPNTCRTRECCCRRWPATRRTEIRSPCVHLATRLTRRPSCSRSARCCTGRRRWPARRAPPASSSTAASRGASAG